MKARGSVYSGKRADWVGRLPVIVVEEGAYVRYLGVTTTTHGHYPMVTVYQMPSRDFHQWFKKTPDLVEAYAEIYREHARVKGITPEALAALGNFIELKGWDMVTKTDEAVTKPGRAKKKEELKTGSAKTARAPRAPKPPAEPKRSVSSAFCELIMAGKLSDDEIFAKVKAEFNLDDNKRGYVSWNRNLLKKRGKHPPEPVGGPKLKPRDQPKPVEVKPKGGVKAKATEVKPKGSTKAKAA